MILDAAKARAARDAGIAQALLRPGQEWFDAALADLVRFVCERGEATIEQFRYDWLTSGKPPPASHKVWGALAFTAAARGHIINTGRYVRARATKTRCHPVAVWAAANR